MIKFSTSEGATKLLVDGSFIDIQADVTLFIKALYESFKQKDERTAMVFKAFVRDELPDIAFLSTDELKRRVYDQEEALEQIKDLKSNLEELKRLFDELN